MSRRIKAKTIPCKHIFSNGTEFEIFLGHQCLNGCVKYRNDNCRILNRIYDAMFDESKFPFSDLLDFEGIGGKVCKSYSIVKVEKKRNPHLQEERGQLSLFGHETEYKCEPTA